MCRRRADDDGGATVGAPGQTRAVEKQPSSSSGACPAPRRFPARRRFFRSRRCGYLQVTDRITRERSSSQPRQSAFLLRSRTTLS